MGALPSHWMPAFLAERLPGGLPADRDQILGERLVAFRDSSRSASSTGVPHRGACTAYGRCGGRPCLHLPRRLEGRRRRQPLRRRLSATENCSPGRSSRRPTRPPRGRGLIWVYMGPREEIAAEFPHWRFCDLPDDHIMAVRYSQPTNWFQALRGDIDARTRPTCTACSMKAYASGTPVEDAFAAFFGFHRSPDGHAKHMPWGVETIWGFTRWRTRSAQVRPDRRRGLPRPPPTSPRHPASSPVVRHWASRSSGTAGRSTTNTSSTTSTTTRTARSPRRSGREINHDFGHHKIDKDDEYRTIATCGTTTSRTAEAEDRRTPGSTGSPRDIAVIQSGPDPRPEHRAPRRRGHRGDRRPQVPAAGDQGDTGRQTGTEGPQSAESTTPARRLRRRRPRAATGASSPATRPPRATPRSDRRAHTRTRVARRRPCVRRPTEREEAVPA
ncbi:hypothetical protein HBB16_19665 [Pseudonocardia sp. MCCB 268]|nr:hypothetical protein [Pseudonocardia cytotoxica]